MSVPYREPWRPPHLAPPRLSLSGGQQAMVFIGALAAIAWAGIALMTALGTLHH